MKYLQHACKTVNEQLTDCCVALFSFESTLVRLYEEKNFLSSVKTTLRSLILNLIVNKDLSWWT